MDKKGKIYTFLWNLHRVIWDVSALIIIFLTALLVPSYIFPEMAKIGLLSIFISKFIFVSAGIIHAHISRKLLFPYIDFSSETDWTNNLMIIAWYITIIFAWSRGG